MYYLLYGDVPTIELLYDNSRIIRGLLDNRPMHESTIKLHKGVDNKVIFKVVNSDKKVQSIQRLLLTFTMINVETGVRVYTKPCRVELEKGFATLIVQEGDISDLSPGFYRAVVTATDSGVQQLNAMEHIPLYTDTASNIRMTVEVMDTVEKTPVPTVTIMPENWSMNTDVNDINPVYISAPIPANRVKNNRNCVHTFATYMTNFTGSLYMYGSLENTPPEDIRYYFPMQITNFNTEIVYDRFTGIDAYTMQANVMWVRFAYKPDPTLSAEQQGTVDKVYYRS